ncbi:MAG: hypothetical protein QNJ31_05905 [Candidatus Caenarcaniphilales bacterium]|nr:hypothetical protein [Candidatus Caenarcaniphilales bacterium]
MFSIKSIRKIFVFVLLIGLFISLFVNFSAKAFYNNSVYRPQVPSGRYQKIGTISPIRVAKKNSLNKTKASQAVILLPGLNSAKLSNELYEWKNFWEAWNEADIDSELKEKYKFFVFRYEGWDSLHESSKILTQGIKEILEKEPNIKSINFIGYSQGGMIPRIIFINNPEIASITNKVQTLASPHQGSIALTKKLTLDSIETQNPIAKSKNKLALRVFSNWYKHAYLEQAWTDFDGALPPSANYKPPEEAVNFPQPNDLSKFFTYASYIFPPRMNDFESKFGIFFGETIPRLLWDRRAGMKELNRWMAKRIYEDEDSRVRDNHRLNDGVTPLSSALWARLCKPDEEQPDNWKKLFPTNNYCPSTHVHRAFYGVDHLMWRESTAARKKVKDLLNPGLEKRPVYSWVIEDLVGLHSIN